MRLRTLRTPLANLRALGVLGVFFCSSATQAQQKPWPIRAVIIATFEVGNDTGDTPGEMQFWTEREHLTEVLDFPGGAILPPGQHALRTNKEHTVLAMLSGTTLVNATASMMALGLDPRFDLTHAYFLINGIAGVDPNIASIGSAAWAHFVIGDVVREIDPREILALRLVPHRLYRAQPAQHRSPHLAPLQPLHPQSQAGRLGLHPDQRP
jgi:purine nucleoside permease